MLEAVVLRGQWWQGLCHSLRLRLQVLVNRHASCVGRTRALRCIEIRHIISRGPTPVGIVV